MISKVKTLEFSNSYPFNNKTYYQFNISFEDGKSGTVSALSQTPPYGVGDTVEVEPNGEYQGVTKFKVKKSDGGNSSVAQTSPANNATNGARSGMLIGRACDCMIATGDISLEAGKRFGEMLTELAEYIEAGCVETEEEPF